MTRLAEIHGQDGIATVTFARSTGNALTADMRRALWDAFGEIAADRGNLAVVLTGGGGTFSGGAEIRDLGDPEPAPSLADLCARIERMTVPVVAALAGPVLGAGFDLALACHHRIAAPDALLALPEVTLGLIPTGGATQRLPRLVGAGAALDLLLSGKARRASALAPLRGLLDGLAEADVTAAARRHARALADADEPPRPVCARRDGLADARANLRAVTDRRHAVAGARLFAPMRIVDCVEAALLLPFDAGLAFEADAAARCRAHPQSRALRHAFVAERTIGRDLMAATDTGRRVVSPRGTAAVGRLQHVMGAVAEHLVAAGKPADLVDRAMIDFGFLRTPFGGRVGGAGIAGDAIAARLVAALMAEGGRIWAEGGVDRAADIDALAIAGAGFPRQQGGPMKAAELIGLVALHKSMQRWKAESALWEPHPVLAEAIKTAAGFDGVRLVRARAG